MMQQNNFAFIDGQNLTSGLEIAGWKLDQRKFRQFLADQFGVTRAFYFIGFMEEHQDIYNSLQEAGFILHFKPLVRHEDSTVKGNVDVDLVLQAMIEKDHYDKAVIVSGDGDFVGLIRYLAENNRLAQVLIPNSRKYSSLFKRLENYQKHFTYLDKLRRQLEYRNRRPRKTSAEPNKEAS